MNVKLQNNSNSSNPTNNANVANEINSDAKSVYESIRKIVSQIPYGKVATYGQIAQMAGIKDARMVGWALRGNTDERIPCHRVVKADGSLAINYSEGDWRDDKVKLLGEDVGFISETVVDLNKHGWNGLLEVSGSRSRVSA